MNTYFREIAKTDKYPFLFRFLVLMLSSWLFQGILYMDKTEKLFKIFTDVFLVTCIFFLLNHHYPWVTNALIAVSLGHTINWIINGQICVVCKNLKLLNNDLITFRGYVNEIQLRIKKEPSIEAAAVFGSLSRESLRETSDLDIRILRKSGMLNGIRACIFVLFERSRGLYSRFPIDIFALDSPEQLDKLDSDEVPIILYDPDKTLAHFYGIDGVIMWKL